MSQLGRLGNNELNLTTVVMADAGTEAGRAKFLAVGCNTCHEFPDLPPEKLDLELYSWLRVGERQPLRIKLAMPRFSITERRLGDADVLALRSFLFQFLKDDEVTARTDAEAALAIDRTNVVAHLVKASLDDAIAPDVATAVATAHPDDYRAWLLVARALHDGSGADAAFARACSLAANVVDACARVAAANVR